MKINTIVILGAFFLFACSDDDISGTECPDVEEGTRYFEFQHHNSELYLAWTNDPGVLNAVDAQLALPLVDRGQHINGKILRNETDCDLNFSWSWYFDPNDWDLADASIELCDGNPQYVEENLDEYISTGRYCPWSSKVLREVNAPF